MTIDTGEKLPRSSIFKDIKIVIKILIKFLFLFLLFSKSEMIEKIENLFLKLILMFFP